MIVSSTLPLRTAPEKDLLRSRSGQGESSKAPPREQKKEAREEIPEKRGWASLSCKLRMINDFFQIAGSIPAVIDIGLLVASRFFSPLERFIRMIQPFNVSAAVLTTSVDAYEALKSMRDPHSTRQERIVDLAHLATDTLSVIGAAMPVSTPIGIALSIALQGIGVTADIANLVHDYHHHCKEQPVTPQP